MRQCKVFVHDIEAGILQETDDSQYIYASPEQYKSRCSDFVVLTKTSCT